MSWSGTKNGGRLRAVVSLSVLLMVAIIAVASMRRDGSIMEVELVSLDPQCRAALQEAANALGWSSLEDYEQNLISQGKPVKCGDRVVKLKDTTQPKKSEDVIQWLFGNLFDDHHRAVKKGEKVERTAVKNAEVHATVAQTRPHAGAIAGGEKQVHSDKSSLKEATGQGQDKAASAVEEHVQKVRIASAPQTTQKVAARPVAEQPASTQVAKQLKPLSWPAVGSTLPERSAKVSGQGQESLASNAEGKSASQKLSVMTLNKLEKKAKKLGYLLVPKSLEREAKNLGYDLVPEAPAAKQEEEKYVLESSVDKTSQLAQIPMKRSELVKEKKEGAEKKSEEEENGKGDELLGGSKVRLEEEAKLESELKEHFKEKEERKKKMLKEEAQQKKRREEEAAMRAVRRYGSMLTFPDETRAKFLKLVERPAEQVKDEETSMIRKKAFKTAVKQLNDYNILEFKEDELHHSAGSKASDKTIAETNEGKTKVVNKQTSLKQRVMVQTENKSKVGEKDKVFTAVKATDVKPTPQSAKTVIAPRTAKLQWDGKGIPHF